MEKKKKLSLRTKIIGLIIIFAIPATIYFGMTKLDNEKYMFISMLILLYTMLPFFLIFEERKPKARELMLIAGLSSIAIAGRVAFFWIPQFKPLMAIVIVTGVALGPESGFLVGAMSAFVSNFYFGQTALTPWQMFSFGIIGFLAGLLFEKKLLKPNKVSMSIYGFIVAFVIYGGIMNPAAGLMFNRHMTWEMVLSYYITGFPFDTIHAVATVIFLYLIGEPMLEKIERIKIKYGFYEE